MSNFVIAIGASRFSENWKNKSVTWPDFLKKLSDTRRTGETFAEYKKYAKADRDNAKDVGGFVAGKIRGHKRLVGNVEYRTMVCLDADHASDAGFISDVELALPDTAWAIYTTHSHCPEAPRYRLIVPFCREVKPDEYQPIARKLAEMIGVETFDPTTYDIHRLMYWPSTSENGEFVFERNKGKPLNVDEILNLYTNWHDIEEWPTSTLEAKAQGLALKKQADPLAKPGLIGAFCRTYTIQAAIEKWLPEVYEPKNDERYTFTGGSTAGGLVIYDNTFAFSHHATDPTSGQLCNAFDLVRIHLYGDQDSGKETDVKKTKSYKAMMDLISHDEATRAALAESDLAELKQLFDDEAIDTGEEIDTKWMTKLERGGKDASILSTAQNVVLILENDMLLKKSCGVDEFSHRLTLLRDLPWRKIGIDAIWRDRDDSCLRNYLSEYYGITGKTVIQDALVEVSNNNSFHPVRQYLKGLQWDGVKRAETLYIDLLGADDTPLNREFTVLHLKAAVARIMHPGTKFDECIVLSGKQGQGKTTVFDWLGGKWFNESITNVSDRNVMEALQGSWIIELSEMQATRKAENDAIKAFISRRVDRFRAPYGMRTEDYPRQCVFAGTVNEEIFLKDRTGGRRFWPIKTHKALDRTVLTEQLRGQIWAEIYTLWKHDGNLQLSKDGIAAARIKQDDATEGSEKRNLILSYLDMKLPPDWAELDLYDRKEYIEEYDELAEPVGETRYKVCVLEIWCEVFGQQKNRLGAMEAREINTIMGNIPNWELAPDGKRHIFGKIYGRQRYYRRKM